VLSDAEEALLFSISMKSFAPLIPQLAVGESWLQQIESVKPALVLHEVGEVDGTVLGTLLSPKYPGEKQREHLPISLLQQMLYFWLDRWKESESL